MRLVNVRCFVTGLLLTFFIPAAFGQSTPVDLFVSSRMDPYEAGGNNEGIGGIPPVSFTFAAAPSQVITFPGVIGQWACGDGDVEYGPDGTDEQTGCTGPRSITGPIGPFSGFASTDFQGALVGVFLADTLPSSAPPRLRFYRLDGSQGGIQTNFTTLSPQLGQMFFIGDGLTGRQRGTIQLFEVPPTATHLYFGYLDGFNGVPGGYSNNIGLIRVSVEIGPQQ